MADVYINRYAMSVCYVQPWYAEHDLVRVSDQSNPHSQEICEVAYCNVRIVWKIIMIDVEPL